MPQKIIPCITGNMYHVYNRGVDKRVVFEDVNDYLRYYTSLRFFNSTEPVVNYSEARRNINLSCKKLVNIHAYCLLPNHFHLLLSQAVDGGLSEFMKRIGIGYTLYFNEKYERSGALFQGKFKRALVEENAQVVHLSAYINYNHIIHGTKVRNELYYSSSSIYEGKKKNTFLDTDLLDTIFKSNKIETLRNYALSINTQRKADAIDSKLLLE